MVTNSWDSYPIEGAAVAPQTGPFPFRPFLETVWAHRGEADADLIAAVDGDAAVAFSKCEHGLTLAGQENLTDYHSPIGQDPVALIASTLANHSGERFRFDSLPAEAAKPMEEALTGLGATVEMATHDVAAVLTLPDSVDDWLMGIGKKERHEVRRKRRKFEAEFGPIVVEQRGEDALGTFCELHRSLPGEKGEFMTDAMEAYFGALVRDAGALIHLLVCNDRPLAAAFGFQTDAGYFYYNSALDFDAAHASPGVVLFSSMISHQIERGAKVFDFLKGDERYKFRHGAEPRDLFVLSGTLP